MFLSEIYFCHFAHHQGLAELAGRLIPVAVPPPPHHPKVIPSKTQNPEIKRGSHSPVAGQFSGAVTPGALGL